MEGGWMSAVATLTVTEVVSVASARALVPVASATATRTLVTTNDGPRLHGGSVVAGDTQTLVYNFIEGLGPAHFERPESRSRRIKRREKLALASK